MSFDPQTSRKIAEDARNRTSDGNASTSPSEGNVPQASLLGQDSIRVAPQPSEQLPPIGQSIDTIPHGSIQAIPAEINHVPNEAEVPVAKEDRLGLNILSTEVPIRISQPNIPATTEGPLSKPTLEVPQTFPASSETATTSEQSPSISPDSQPLPTPVALQEVVVEVQDAQPQVKTSSVDSADSQEKPSAETSDDPSDTDPWNKMRRQLDQEMASGE